MRIASCQKSLPFGDNKTLPWVTRNMAIMTRSHWHVRLLQLHLLQGLTVDGG